MKTTKSIIKITLFLLPLFVIFFSCQVGLGESVDLQPPVLEILSHQDNDSVAESFALFGTASDNDEVISITIDFEDADIHFKIVPGGNWQKKTSASGDWITLENNNNTYCTLVDGVWKWSVDVDTRERISTKTDTAYSFTAIASDKLNNTGKSSKADCTLIVDNLNPNVSIYKPELVTGNYESIAETAATYNLNDGNVIAQLLNGDLVIKGHQSDAISFKALRIQLDNGKLQSGVTRTTSGSAVTSIEDIDANEKSLLGDDPVSDIYFSRTIESSDLREWTTTIKPEEWATTEAGIAKGLNTGMHVIRVVTTSLSSSNAWEHKIIGYFVWWPEADKPWITTAIGANTKAEIDADEDNKYACYPGSNFSGSAQDDDCIKSFTSKLYKYNEGNDTFESYSDLQNHELPSADSKYLAWAVKIPVDSGIYKLDLEIQDYTGNATYLTKYFKTSDVSAPKIELSLPIDNSSAIVDEQGNITFTGTVSDNCKVAKLAMVHLNPAKASDVSNKIKYLTGEDPEWNTATVEGKTDADGNILFKFETNNAQSYDLNKTFNLYTDFGIDGNTKLLSSQEFIFRAVDDSGSKTVKTITLTGDSSTPDLTFKTITINAETQNFQNGNIPSFPKINNGTTATITGVWSDEFYSGKKNVSKVNNIEVSWGSAKVYVVPNADGNWSCNITAPKSGGTITAQLKDFGGNTKTVQTAVSIETSDLGLSRIDCKQDDGAYMAGSVLEITLEFTKNTSLKDGTPTLTLNNGATATYVSGSGTASHVYKYTVGPTDRDTENLTVMAINNNGAVWYDSAATSSELDLTVADIPVNGNLGNVRTIKIDNTKPIITNITALSSTGYYGPNTSILLMMEFSENVTITNPDGLRIKFNHTNSGAEYKDSDNCVMAGNPSVSGSKAILFTYNIKDGDNANSLSFNSVKNTSAAIKDAAGNSLENLTPQNTVSFNGFIIKTSKPTAPAITFTGGDVTKYYIFDAAGCSFTLATAATDIASQEYSLDNGDNWTPYTGTVSLTNNGTYNVVSRQTDKAGNASDKSSTTSFVIDKGNLLTKVTADTPNGTYSTNTAIKTIAGRIQFRKEVTIPRGTKVTINVKNNNSDYKTIPITQCETSDGTGTEFTFTYTIVEGDEVVPYQGGEKKLNVLGWVLLTGTTVKIGTVAVDIGEPVTSFSTNRDIRILTGKPKLISANPIEFNGEGPEAVLTVTYDRDISKVSGNIEFEYDTTISGNDFHVPAVLTASEYNELKLNSAISDNYEKGTNGATRNGNTLTNDTATKYILKTTVGDTNSDIVAVFKNANKHKVTIPVISDQVTVSGSVLTVTLGETYALPVKGAKYKLTIPTGAVTDEVKNVNEVYTQTVTADGVEAPEIRIVKPRYSITGTGNTKTASVSMTDVQTAKMFLSCRTPGATIKYVDNTLESSEFIINSSPILDVKTGEFVDTSTFTTKTTDATVSETLSKTYSGSTGIQLGSDKAVNTYALAKGLKIAITAQAEKDSKKSEYSYEYATRSVLKLYVQHYRDGDGSEITDGDSSLKMRDLRVWVTGGDSPSGPNSVECPFAWSDTSTYKMMAGGHTVDNTMYGEWWFVSWDITSATHFGFILGNVPSDANTNGPKFWYNGDYLWTLSKEQYALNPGETLLMAAHGDANDWANSVKRQDSAFNNYYYYIPYGARFSFNKQKYFTR